MFRPTPAVIGLALCVSPIAAQDVENGAISVARSATVEPAAPQALVLKATADVDGSSILLRDVADLAEDCPWALVDLGPAPLAGHSKTITAPQIELKLERSGFAAEAGAITGAGQVVVTRQARVPSAADLQQALKQMLPFEVAIERLPPRRPLPLGQIGYRLGGSLPNPMPERFILALDVLVDQRVCDQLSLTVRRIDATPELVAGPQVTPVTEVPEVYQSGLAAEPVAARDAMAAERPAAPAWQVKRGDKLTVVAVSGSVRITLMAEARETGTLNDIVQCETRINNERRLLAARLVAPDKAILEF